MSTQKPNGINQLLGQYLNLQDQWMDSPENFNWEALKVLATVGAHFYNEGNGLSFQILATDGMEHGEFHLRFLEYSLAAGFDPFKLVRRGSGDTLAPVFAHESLANVAEHNPWSARMQACLHNVARERFGMGDSGDVVNVGVDLAMVVACCRDSIPDDVFAKLANGLLAA